MAEKDLEKAKRLNEVYKHLFAHFDVKSQTDFADKLKIQRTGLSAAMNGSKANLTKNLFMKICATYPGVFNLEYLLNGSGDLLTIEEQVKSEEIEQSSAQPQIPDYVQRLCEEAARVAQRSEMLELQLSNSLADVRGLKEKLDTALASVNSLKEQLTTVLQVFNSPRAIRDFHQSVVNDQPTDNIY